MKSFTDLASIAESLEPAFNTHPISDVGLKGVLGFFAETKYTCEANEGLIYKGVDGYFNLRTMRDLCIAGLNFSGNENLLKARFYSVWSQINAIPYD